MRVDGDISQINNISFKQEPIAKAINTNSRLFDEFYQSAISLVDETNKLQMKSDYIQQDFAAGRTDDMLAVIMAQEKASSSLNFTVQVTNKVIEAYREIMRMQI